jgi:hypothetical protein
VKTPINAQIEHVGEQALEASHHQLETLFRMMAEKSAAFYARRITSNLTQNAEQRYAESMEKFPELVQRLPQYAAAVLDWESAGVLRTPICDYPSPVEYL